ncbi:hypothetical protein STEG23_005511, partial [Scotinomys teguina]
MHIPTDMHTQNEPMAPLEHGRKQTQGNACVLELNGYEPDLLREMTGSNGTRNGEDSPQTSGSDRGTYGRRDG